MYGLIYSFMHYSFIFLLFLMLSESSMAHKNILKSQTSYNIINF